jgi:hypothetical protein
MLPVLVARSARLLVGAAVVAVVIGGPAAVAQAAVRPAAVPVAGEPEPGLVTLDDAAPPEEDAGSNEEKADDSKVDGEVQLNSTGEDPGGDGSATGAGAEAPLLPSDVDLLVKARLAGLWEMPAGQMAQEKGSSERVR